VDLNKGEPVVAAFDGKIRIAERRGGYGNVVVIMHPNGLETVYAHLSKLKVKEGQVVLSGQTIGLGGSTGHSTGSHLHFEVRYKGHAVNPATFISFTENKLYDNMIVFKKTRNGINAYPVNAGFHTVKKGETWTMIAKKYGMNYKELCQLNGTQKRYYLKPGQKIRVN
jgi:murein DD-endopeptidase MepM/ murein hydrolase activator NlpD